MTNDEWMELFARFSGSAQSELVLVLQNGGEIAVDLFIRFEPNYFVARGRVSGTDNEGRAFFVPFRELSYLRIEKITKLSDIQVIYGEEATMFEKSLGEISAEEAAAMLTPPPPPGKPVSDPKRATRSEEVRDKLLERIRSTKTGRGPTSGSQ